jgi:hypothetical protein
VSQKKIRAAYESRLATWAAARSPALRVQYENVPFTPAQGETFLKAYLLPAKTQSPDVQGALTVYMGVFQVSVYAPINNGSGAALGIADELSALFVTNVRLTQSGLTVQQVTPCSIAPALQDATSYVIPVSFQYRADA